MADSKPTEALERENHFIQQVVASFLLMAEELEKGEAVPGPVGVAATTVLGLVFTTVYLGTGSLFTAIVAHAGLDLFNAVVRPWLHRALSSAAPLNN